MKVPVAIVDLVPFAQCIQAVSLARMLAPGQLKGIQDAAMIFHLAVMSFQAGQFGIDEAHVERGVVYDYLATFDEPEETVGDFGKKRLVGQELIVDAVYVHRILFDASLGVDIEMKTLIRQSSVDQFDASDFYDSVSFFWIQSGSFSIQNNLTHPGFLSIKKWPQSGKSVHQAANQPVALSL